MSVRVSFAVAVFYVGSSDASESDRGARRVGDNTMPDDDDVAQDCDLTDYYICHLAVLWHLSLCVALWGWGSETLSSVVCRG